MSTPAQELQTVSAPASLLQIAVERGADVDQLTKLMDLQERYDREQARRAFFAAKTKFQSICPPITKDRTVEYGNTKYTYATLGHIAETLRAPLEKCGLSYRYEIHDEGSSIRVSCILSHIDGHSESNTMSALPDDSGAKNDIQQRGSTVTYLQRYTLIGALGLASANEDDDGKATGSMNVERLRKHTEAVREFWDCVNDYKLAVATEDYDKAAEAWYDMPQAAQIDIYSMATTKGGILTTAERAFMKSEGWSEAAKLRREAKKEEAA